MKDKHFDVNNLMFNISIQMKNSQKLLKLYDAVEWEVYTTQGATIAFSEDNFRLLPFSMDSAVKDASLNRDFTHIMNIVATSDGLSCKIYQTFRESSWFSLTRFLFTSNDVTIVDYNTNSVIY